MEYTTSTQQPGNEAAPSSPKSFQTFKLSSFCYSDRPTLLPELNTALTLCGGWMLERKTLSPSAMEFLFEVELETIVELYGSLVGLGIEFTRSTHTTLTDLCTCRKHRFRSADPFRVITLHLEISFLADVTLHSVLMTGAGLA